MADDSNPFGKRIDPDTYHAIFEEDFKTEDPWSFKTSEYELTKYRRQTDVAKEHMPDPQQILEISCAEGVYTEMLADAFKNAHITGIEISHTALERANKRLEEYIKEGRITLTEGDITKEIYNLPENSSDLTFWSESIPYLNALITPVDIYNCLKQLHKIQKQGSLLVMANIIDQEGYPEGPITRKVLMDNIKSIISEFFEPVCEKSYRDFKKEENQEFDYEIWVFRKD